MHICNALKCKNVHICNAKLPKNVHICNALENKNVHICNIGDIICCHLDAQNHIKILLNYAL